MELVVDDEYWADTSHIVSYGSRNAQITIDPEFPETDYDAAKVYLGLFAFPDEGLVHETIGPSFTRSDGRQSFTLSIDADTVDTSSTYYYLAGLLPEDASERNTDYTRLTSVMETDPFRYGSARRDISRTDYENELADDSGSTYSRNNVEGAYDLEVSGRTNGQSWTVNFFAYKSGHASARQRSRGRSRPEYVNYELTEGTAGELANLLKDNAESLGFSDHEAVEFVIDFVQALPYVPDDVSRGFDDYTKFIMETVPEMAGDCEDTAILLASILQAEPFNYDMILIQPPGHMAAGLWNSEPSGYYWELDGRKYEYIETTGRGWGIGDCPEEYRNTEAYLFQV